MRRLFVIFILFNWVIEIGQEASLRGHIVELFTFSCKELAEKLERGTVNDWITLITPFFAVFCRKWVKPLGLVERGSIALEHIAVPEGRILQGAFLALEIHVDDSEALLIAQSPLKVI